MPSRQKTSLPTEFDGGLHMIFLAGGNAPAGENEIMPSRRGGEAPRELVAIVAQDAEIDDFRAEAGEQAREQQPVRIMDRAFAETPARLDQLVARREQRDPQPSPDLDGSEADRGGKCHVLGLHPAAGRQDEGTATDVFAHATQIGASAQASRQDDMCLRRPRVFLHEHGVGVGGQRRTREDADGDAFRDDPGRRAASRDAAAQGQLGRTLRSKIHMAHGIAIDRRIGERRQRDRREDIGRDHAPVGLRERYSLFLRDRHDPFGDQRQRRFDRHERAAEGEAIVGQLRHSRRIIEIAMFFDSKVSHILSTGSLVGHFRFTRVPLERVNAVASAAIFWRSIFRV